MSHVSNNGRSYARAGYQSSRDISSRMIVALGFTLPGRKLRKPSGLV